MNTLRIPRQQLHSMQHELLAIIVDLNDGLFAALATHRYRLFLMTRVFCRKVISLPGLRLTASSYALLASGDHGNPLS
jgi:hypothetical protein